METPNDTPNCHILTNSPALHSLKRQQLVQLCKRNGIKATGKNADMVQKLKAHGLHHPRDLSSFGGHTFSSDDDDGDKENKQIGATRLSEVWSVIEEDSREVERVQLGLQDIREEVEQEMNNLSPLKGFGVSNVAEFGNNGTSSSKGSSMTSSIKAFATSLKRAGSKTDSSQDSRLKQSSNGLRQVLDNRSKMSTEPTSRMILPNHAQQLGAFDSLTATSTPYHAHPQTYPPLPSPQPLDADDSRDQSILDLGASTIRLVTTAPVAPSPPVLRPFTPTFEPSYSPGSPTAPTLCSSSPLPPGGFPDVISTPSNLSKPSGPAPQPFLFGSPAHHISNKEFNSAATSVLAEMNSRLGLTGTVNEVGLDLLQNRSNTETLPLPESQDRPRTDVTSMFDRAHERQFQKMEGLGEWYARRTGASPGKTGPQGTGTNRKRKSDVLGGPHRMPIKSSNPRARRSSRVVTPGTRRSLVAAAAAEETDGRKMKRVKIVEGGDESTATVNKSQDGSEMDDDNKEKAQTSEERERERAAIKKKLEVSRARRRSSMGRVSVGGGRPPLIPNQPAKKGMATKFGFMASAKSLVKNVWKGVGSGASKQSSTISIPGPSHNTAPSAAKKLSSNVLTKPPPAVKPSIAKHPVVNATTAKPGPNSSLRAPAMGVGLGRKSSARIGTNGTNSTMGTRSSTASSGITRTNTISSVSGIPSARRGPIPSFQQPQSGVLRTNSLASAGGTLGSRTSSGGTGSSRGTSAASSIGLKKPKILSGIRQNDEGNSSTSNSRKRTSTLFAPTASSLAKMQSTVRPPSLTSAASRPSATGAESRSLAKVLEQKSSTHDGLSSFSFGSPPPISGISAPSGGTSGKGPESIFSGGVQTFSPSHMPIPETDAPKSRAHPARRPRISRSRVIARVGAQRAASGSSMTRTPSGRRSFNTPKTRGSLGARVSGIGAKGNARDLAAMNARKRLRQSEILRRRSKLSGVSPALLEREDTPESGHGTSTEEDRSHEDHGGARLDMSLED